MGITRAFDASCLRSCFKEPILSSKPPRTLLEAFIRLAELCLTRRGTQLLFSQYLSGAYIAQEPLAICSKQKRGGLGMCVESSHFILPIANLLGNLVFGFVLPYPQATCSIYSELPSFLLFSVIPH